MFAVDPSRSTFIDSTSTMYQLGLSFQATPGTFSARSVAAGRAAAAQISFCSATEVSAGEHGDSEALRLLDAADHLAKLDHGCRVEQVDRSVRKKITFQLPGAGR